MINSLTEVRNNYLSRTLPSWCSFNEIQQTKLFQQELNAKLPARIITTVQLCNMADITHGGSHRGSC